MYPSANKIANYSMYPSTTQYVYSCTTQLAKYSMNHRANQLVKYSMNHSAKQLTKFPDTIHYLILYSFRNNNFLKIPGSIVRYLVRTNSTH